MYGFQSTQSKYFHASYGMTYALFHFEYKNVQNIQAKHIQQFSNLYYKTNLNEADIVFLMKIIQETEGIQHQQVTKKTIISDQLIKHLLYVLQHGAKNNVMHMVFLCLDSDRDRNLDEKQLAKFLKYIGLELNNIEQFQLDRLKKGHLYFLDTTLEFITKLMNQQY